VSGSYGYDDNLRLIENEFDELKEEIQSLKAMIVECRPWIGSDSIREHDKQKQWLTKTENIRVE